MPAILFRNFSYAYQENQKVLHDINMTIPRGSFTVVTGPGGAGKTTLCLAVCGAVPHFYGGSIAGEVIVGGNNTIGIGMGELANAVGIVLEDYDSQLVTMSVEEEVAFALENGGLADEVIKERVQESLAWVGLSGLERREIGSLSGGQRQRLAIAAVLAARPGILVLDEPASALDPEGTEELYALLASLESEHGVTILIVEHDLARVLAYVDQIAVLVGGRLVRAGNYDEVLPYLEACEDFQAMTPSLWQVKSDLEQELGARFGNWRQVPEAAAELTTYLTGGVEGSRSA